MHRIQVSTSIYKLATSPLLCAVICALHRDRMQNIPEDRIELYEACVDMFLRRDHERRIQLPQYPSLSSRQIKALLSDLAYWFIRNGVSLADASDVDSRFEKKLGGFKSLPEDTDGASVRMGFVARSGILREPSSSKVDFPHRTFQEFLAAKEIVDQRDFGVLNKNVDDQQNWRETIILAVGLANQHEAEAFIRELLTRFDKNSDINVLLLAVGCLETAVAISDSVKNMVEERIQKILPPKNMSEARTLANAGDLVVPLINDIQKLKGPGAQASVATLAYIGTERAMSEIQKTGSKDNRRGTWRRIVKMVSRCPDPDEYIRTIFGTVSKITESTSRENAVLKASEIPIGTLMNDATACYLIRKKVCPTVITISEPGTVYRSDLIKAGYTRSLSKPTIWKLPDSTHDA